MTTSDFLIVGGGVVGLSVAREIAEREPRAKIALIEKEPFLGAHASGRNSGVLHSGIYDTADSLKARLTKDGNAALSAWCDAKQIPVRRCGKLIVARRESEHPMLDELLRRGAANGVAVEDLPESEARKIEPRAKTAGRALFVPSTASVDPRRVIDGLESDCRERRVAIATSTCYLGIGPGDLVRTSAGSRSAGFVVNCAGLYADRVARDFGFSRRYRILPFKGLYLEAPEPAGSLRCHVYPVPAATNPFLGVHATVKADGRWKIGPTAIPAFWRENYSGFANFDAGELVEIAAREISLLFGSRFDFRRLAWEELRKQSKKRIVALATKLVARIGTPGWTWGVPGIRAQLVDVESRTLVGDFVLEGDDRSLHVLNAVSPAFTCCLTFAKIVADRAIRR